MPVNEEPKPKIHFCFSARIERTAFHCYFTEGDKWGWEHGRTPTRQQKIDDASMHGYPGKDDFRLVVPDRRIETVLKAIERIVREDYGVDVDDEDHYRKTEYNVLSIHFENEVRV